MSSLAIHTLCRTLAVAFAVVLTGVLAPATSEAATRTPAHPVVRAVALHQSDDAYNRDIRIHNQTGWTMTYFYASSGDGWGPDLLGSSTLGPGDSIVLTVDDGSGACRYEFRAEFDNGQSLQRSGINVCQVADYYYTR